jgi:hypothetical protein
MTETMPRPSDRVCGECGGPIPPTRAPQARYCTQACSKRRNGRLSKERHPERIKQNSRESARRRYAANPEAQRKRQLAWREANADLVRERERRRFQRNTYGVELEDMPYRDAQAIRRGMREGYRSGLEEKIAASLARRGEQAAYEATVLAYTMPEKARRYTPDWVLSNGIIVESKGRFVTADRQKMVAVKKAHPHLDIRFVFSNSKTRIGKTSTTTYGMWAEKHGFPYADKDVPDAWLKEPPK